MVWRHARGLFEANAGSKWTSGGSERRPYPPEVLGVETTNHFPAILFSPCTIFRMRLHFRHGSEDSANRDVDAEAARIAPCSSGDPFALGSEANPTLQKLDRCGG